jgi:hypothetical protein
MLRGFINEQSLPNKIIDQNGSIALVLSLVSCLRGIRRYRRDLCLNSISKLLEIPVTGDSSNTVGICLSRNGTYKEHLLFLKNLNQKSPLLASAENLIAEDEIYHINGREVLGLALSYLVNGIAVSLETDSAWMLERITITKELQHGSEEISVRNASNNDHVNSHKNYLTVLAGMECNTGSDIWDNCIDEYPGLIFLPRVKEDLQGYDVNQTAAQSIHVALKKLSSSFKDWEASDDGTPSYSIHVTPEYEQRKKYCNYYDQTVKREMLFDTHARFTPGAGRIHFRADGNIKKGVVAYIGVKLKGNIT